VQYVIHYFLITIIQDKNLFLIDFFPTFRNIIFNLHGFSYVVVGGYWILSIFETKVIIVFISFIPKCYRFQNFSHKNILDLDYC